VPGPKPWRCRVAGGRNLSRCRVPRTEARGGVRRCSGPKPFACRAALGRSLLPCRPGKKRSKLLFNPFSVVSVKSLPSAEAGGVVSGRSLDRFFW
jgi:hypothetical protein